MLFDYMGINLNGPKAERKTLKLNFVFPDVSLENSALTPTIDRQAEKADATTTMTRSTLDELMLKKTTFPARFWTVR
jgi:alkyl sulfatase BDS1-like metallo-beta-lactamase superfamily hydrolase